MCRVVISDISERKCAEEKSRQFSQQIESAAVHVKSLMAEVILKNDFTTRFDNSSLTPCWEAKKCDNTACRSYRDSVNLRCWDVAGTLCGGKVQGSCAQKLGNCRLCEVYQRARINPVNDLGETFNNMITVLSDRHEELKKINQALEKSNHLAEAATLAKSEFLANMSHEIRTPIAAILGYAEVLLSEEGLEKAPEQRRKAFNTIQRNGKHLLGLINDILDLSKVESGQIQIEPIRCSPGELLADVASLMRVPAAAKHLTIQTDLAGPLPETMLTDPLRLRQVFVNLVGNAIKFTEKGEVRIAVRLISCGAVARAGETPAPQVVLRFDVTDTGIGMSEEQIGRLFQAFSQSDNSSTRKFG
ncbi:MAG: histidine kinase dimerization/phospho-acceptor domain-containing protein, partial [Planctomycetota bacterium]